MNKHDTAYLQRFYSAISRAERWLQPDEPIPPSLDTGRVNEYGFREWSPARQQTEPRAIETIYETIPGRVPKLFEQCLASFRWLEVDLPGITLLAHPPGPRCEGFVSEVIRDPHLYPTLFRERFMQFGKGGTLYDPICFDLRRKKKEDCPIVRIDHESVLIHEKAEVVEEIAPTFRKLLEML